MEITLEKIDLLRERTGVSYREAREVLRETDGNVIEALVMLEDRQGQWKQDLQTWRQEMSVKGTEIGAKIKEVLHQGNINKITVKQNGKKVLEIPVVLGAIGGLLLPELAVLGVLGALFKQYTIELAGEGDRPAVESGQHRQEQIGQEPH